MLFYTPLQLDFQFNATASDLIGLRWNNSSMTAWFLFRSDDAKVVEVAFAGGCIARVLDEFALSTESGAVDGIIPGNFAYVVEGSVFSATQSPTWLEVVEDVRNYQLVTGGGCLDVLSSVRPAITLVDRSAAVLW